MQTPHGRLTLHTLDRKPLRMFRPGIAPSTGQDASAASQCSMKCCIRIQLGTIRTTVTERIFKRAQSSDGMQTTLFQPALETLADGSGNAAAAARSGAAVRPGASARCALAARVRAVTHLWPIALPFFAPREFAGAHRACFFRQVALRGHGTSGSAVRNATARIRPCAGNRSSAPVP